MFLRNKFCFYVEGQEHQKRKRSTCALSQSDSGYLASTERPSLAAGLPIFQCPDKAQERSLDNYSTD